MDARRDLVGAILRRFAEFDCRVHWQLVPAGQNVSNIVKLVSVVYFDPREFDFENEERCHMVNFNFKSLWIMGTSDIETFFQSSLNFCPHIYWAEGRV